MLLKLYSRIIIQIINKRLAITTFLLVILGLKLGNQDYLIVFAFIKPG